MNNETPNNCIICKKFFCEQYAKLRTKIECHGHLLGREIRCVGNCSLS